MAWMQEIFDTLYDPNTICVACISHGKDSLAMLRAIKLLGLPLHRIVTSDVWATQDIPADLPPMWEWKKEADKIIKELYGIEVEHICAIKKSASQNVNVERESYESMFYRPISVGRWSGNIKGFPCTKGSWCKKLKYEQIDIRRYILSEIQGRKETCTDMQRYTIRTVEGNSRIYGFPMRSGNWCTTYLKPTIRISDLHQTGTMVSTTQALFRKPHERGAKNKCRSISRYSCGRAVAYQAAH